MVATIAELGSAPHGLGPEVGEPPHVHVERETSTAKFWLEPIELARSHGFSARELNVIRRIITTHREVIVEAWHEHCG